MKKMSWDNHEKRQKHVLQAPKGRTIRTMGAAHRYTQ
jgi:hypothetical protein